VTETSVLLVWERPDVPPQRYQLAQREVFDITFSPCGSMFVADGNKHAVVYDTMTGRQLHTIVPANEWSHSIAFLDGSSRIAALTDKHLEIWDTSTWRQLLSLSSEDDEEMPYGAWPMWNANGRLGL